MKKDNGGYRDPNDPWGGSSLTHEIFRVALIERRPRTYALTWPLIQRIDALAARLQVGQSDLARFLLSYALDQVEQGKVQIPTRALPGRIIDG